MGAFNTVATRHPCPHCGAPFGLKVQFKYGMTWQLAYAVGDVVAWGGLQVGDSKAARIVADGICETPCPRCGFNDDWPFYVHVRDGRITSVLPADGRFSFHGETPYVVLERDSES